MKNTCSSDHGCDLSGDQAVGGFVGLRRSRTNTHSNRSWQTRFTGRSFTLQVRVYTGSRTVKVKGSGSALQKEAVWEEDTIMFRNFPLREVRRERCSRRRGKQISQKNLVEGGSRTQGQRKRKVETEKVMVRKRQGREGCGKIQTEAPHLSFD